MYCADGVCTPNQQFGFYQTRWRRWPDDSAARKAESQRQLQGIPKTTVPDPFDEGSLFPEPIRPTEPPETDESSDEPRTPDGDEGDRSQDPFRDDQVQAPTAGAPPATQKHVPTGTADPDPPPPSEEEEEVNQGQADAATTFFTTPLDPPATERAAAATWEQPSGPPLRPATGAANPLRQGLSNSAPLATISSPSGPPRMPVVVSSSPRSPRRRTNPLRSR
jgi:hypothetical protein